MKVHNPSFDFAKDRQSTVHRLTVYSTILILFFLELAVFGNLKVFGVKPDLLLIATIFFGFHFGCLRGMEIGLISGLLEDLFSITTFGINAFSFLLIGFLSGYLRKTLYKENFIIQFLFSNFFVWILSFIHFLYLAETLETGSYLRFWLMVLYKGLYTGILTPVLFYLFALIYRHGAPETA